MDYNVFLNSKQSWFVKKKKEHKDIVQKGVFSCLTAALI